MGRHSMPAPGESFGESGEPADAGVDPSGGIPRADADADTDPSGRIPRADGDWQGRRRRTDSTPRGVSRGVIAALVAVVVLVGGVILWRFFGDAMSRRSQDAAQQCVQGTATVAVVADSAIVETVTKLAEAYNAEAMPVGDKCVTVAVTQADSNAVVNGLAGAWPTELGERPALWIPASSVQSSRLQAVAGKQIVSDARSLVTSPVVLAVRPQLAAALGQQGWPALPALQTDPVALDANLPGWGSLRLALPVAGASDAAYLAAEAVATTSAPPGAPPTAGLGAVSALLGGQPQLADNTADLAWNALTVAGDPAKAPVHAMVTTEQQLFARTSALPDAKTMVAEWIPDGPIAVADFPTVLLAGPWLAEEQISAASEFARFMDTPEQLAELAKAGFRATGTTPPGSEVVGFPTLGATLPVADDATRAAVAGAVAPASAATTTVILDQGMTGDEGGPSRLAGVTSALNNRIAALPPNAVVGLWTFDGTDSRPVIPTGALSDDLGGQPRSAALTSTLTGLSPTGGGAVSFTTLPRAYTDAIASYQPGQPNSILVITQGPHTDQTLDGPGLQNYLKSAADPNRPVTINVIDFGGDPDRPTWEAVAAQSGGSYQEVATSDSPDLVAAIARMLS